MAYFGRLLCSKVLARSLSISTKHINRSAVMPLIKFPSKSQVILDKSYYLRNARYYCSKIIHDRYDEIIDVDEEMLRYNYEEIEENTEIEEEELEEHLHPYFIDRGESGVYDIDQLVAALQDEKLRDICVISVPKEFNYCSQLIIATGKTFNILSAAAQKIKKYYKKKRNHDDPESVRIEGMISKNWLAIDLGNIVLHLFLKEQRNKFNLEELWTVGPEFDDQYQAHAEVSDFSFSDTSFEEELMKLRNSKITD